MAAMESPEPELTSIISEASGDKDSEELCTEISDNENLKNGDFSDDDGNLDSDIDDDVFVSYEDALLQGPLHDSVQAEKKLSVSSLRQRKDAIWTPFLTRKRPVPRGNTVPARSIGWVTAPAPLPTGERGRNSQRDR